MESSEYKIGCVVVTFNRKRLLKDCLDAIVNQTLKPQHVYIVDNASSDGTENSVKEWGYWNREVNDINFEYILMPANTGGAGGFHTGIKIAYETHLYDAVWVMDDDGIPEQDCLKHLVEYLGNYHFISPLVVSRENKNELSFYDGSIEEFQKNAKNNVITNAANPFNGVLFSKELIAKIGYPKKEMFIWGDEVNYQFRARKHGFVDVTIVDALHYHPKDRQKILQINNLLQVIEVDSSWKLYCLIRNRVYNYKKFSTRRVAFKKIKWLFKSYLYYSLKIKKDIGMFYLVIKAIYDGLNENFNNLRKYM